MNYIYNYNENLTNGYNIEYLWLISLISIFCAILVIIAVNPVISILFLIGLFFSISCYLMMLGINYIGLSYLLVYVGAVSILFLFILMLINIRVSELFNNTNNSIPLAMITIIFFSYFIQKVMPYIINLPFFEKLNSTVFNNMFSIYYTNLNFDYVNFVTSNNWDTNLSEMSHINSIGNILYTSYSIWLVITSIILLLAMVGAIIITIRQKK